MKNTKLLPAVVGSVVGFANGLFGSGGGTLLVPALQKYFRLEAHRAHATALSIILPLSVLSAGLYIFGHPIDWPTVGWVTLGGIPGGLAGAWLLKKVPTVWLHRIFGAFMAAAALRMIFGS